MKDDMKWEQKDVSGPAHASGTKNGDYTDSGIFKAGLALVAGLIIAALARGLRKSDDFEEYSKEDFDPSEDFDPDEDFDPGEDE